MTYNTQVLHAINFYLTCICSSQDPHYYWENEEKPKLTLDIQYGQVLNWLGFLRKQFSIPQTVRVSCVECSSWPSLLSLAHSNESRWISATWHDFSRAPSFPPPSPFPLLVTAVWWGGGDKDTKIRQFKYFCEDWIFLKYEMFSWYSSWNLAI